MLKSLCSILLFFSCFSLLAQITNEGTPASWNIRNKSTLRSIVLPSVDIKKVKSEDAVNDKIRTKPFRIGVSHKVNYGLNNTGKWTELENGDRIWQLGFNSKEALNLSVNFNQFFLPEGGKVYLYNEDKSDLIGAYTNANNNKDEVLGSWFVEGDKLWVEYYEPKEVVGQGKLNISSVVHGYRLGKKYQKGYLNEANQKIDESGDCNQDVDCPIGADFEAQRDILKKSVAFLNMGDGFICSGTLINNTAQDKTPYFLTANHCFDRDASDPAANPALFSMRFNWISPNPDCATTAASTNSPTNFVMSGSVERARSSESDVALLEINNPIPVDWDITYAGWDRSDAIPSFQVGIHHPSGDIMKICRDNDSASKVTQFGVQTWDINGLTESGNSGNTTGWELGVTEGGSSGSALFDQNGRIIGQLLGGLAGCSGLDDNNRHDYYGRFAVSWDMGNSQATRLKDWLDPLNTNSSTLNSFPSGEVFAVDGAVSSSIPEILCGDFEAIPTITVRNAGSTILTSLTLNWGIDGGALTTINWTGSLSQNETENILLSPINLTSGTHTFNVNSSNPNGVADENTSNDVLSNSFSITNEFEASQVHFTLTTDEHSDETTWRFKNSDGTIIASGGPYNGSSENNTTFEETFNVLSECYTFEISDSQNDGICCSVGNGSYSLKTDDNEIIFNGNGKFGASEAVNISIINNEFISKNILIYPNPTQTGAVKISGFVSGLKYDIYNTIGQLVKTGLLIDNEINLSSLASSIYLIKLSEIKTNKSVVKKIILSK